MEFLDNGIPPGIHNTSLLSQIYNSSHYSVQTYLQDLEQMVALESNQNFQRRTNKVNKMIVSVDK